MNSFWYYVLGVNILGFVLMGLDKYFSIKDQYRISENTLLSVALIGGSVGSYIGMFFFHHKTKKRRFLIGIPCCILLHIYCLFQYL
ncbi:MAG: DUF1294 domain-containing protein [Bacilli bacterium]|nr:DUF1294 domain-containing protein [Bacilli bacterium]